MTFDDYRTLLFAIAYRILGSAADAEDAVQDAWLKWSAADRSRVADPKAYLARIVTNLAMDQLRSTRRQRETYVGPWLPEPILTTPETADADSVSMAMLVVLETLSPLERAAFVLREVFDLPVGEIARTLGRSEAAVRQLTHRAREHVQARRPRQTVDKARHSELTLQFLEATMTGDLDQVMSLLAPDVVLISDGGGKRRAALRPIHGPEKIARWLIAVVTRPDVVGMVVRLLEVNGEEAFVSYNGDDVDSVGFLEVDEQGVISEIYLVRNPDKLGALPRLSELPAQD
jgi:RNA polymerase sigma-70 factor (ECF subfamily)